jgi:diaminohydroxyphosphoribosylaminopyrimidine deaminase / 5-amino-6-(5-phosphoribosylamino)uracil reductase
MRCPFCGHAESQVKDSRPSEDGAAIRRRRLCPECGGRFTTFERVQLRELTILKRSGRRTPFERDKLARSIAIATRKRPIDPDRIERMISSIVRQLESMGETELPSSAVGELVMKQLKALSTATSARPRISPNSWPRRAWRRRRRSRVPVTLKLATSLDGRIATAAGLSRWITGEASREEVHRLRAEHNAVLVGISTALADDPELTVRLPDYAGPQPARVVLDSRQRLSPASKLARTAKDVPTYVVATGEADRALVDVGVRVLSVRAADGERPDLGAVVAALATEGLHRLFVEGGGQVAASFVRAGLVDALEWFRAPVLIGGEGRPGVGALAVATLAEAPHFRRVSVQELGPDLWERYART